RREPERERAHDQVRRQEREADLERAIPEHELEVERRQEEQREHRRRPEDADRVRGRDVPQAEEPERHERLAHARLERQERAATRKCCDCESPQASEAVVKNAMPPRKSRRWPKRSPSRPPSSMKPPNVST